MTNQVKRLNRIIDENENVKIDFAKFDCYNCGNAEMKILLDEGGYVRSWPCCTSCGSRINHVLSGLANRGIEI